MWKLYSRKGTYLGIITVPEHWNEDLRMNLGINFAVMPKLQFAYSPNPRETAAVIQTGQLRRSYECRDSVHLWGVDLETFETLPGCSFSPSAAYIRSLME